MTALRAAALLILSILCGSVTVANPAGPPPHLPIPSERQLAWHQLEYYGFVHFTTNTFTGKEWGYGDESPDVFNPSQLDVRQWARTAKEAGMKGLILTAKHHDGFCLWPSEYTEHSVKNSPYKDGRGDVVHELSEACDEFGLKMGVYLSPWDRNHEEYGREPYVTYYQQQLRELLSNYGDIFEVWHDGANGGDGYYGGARERRSIDRTRYYRFPEVYALTRKLQPQAVIFGGIGSDIRWVGNERGYAPDTCWAKINPIGTALGAENRARIGTGDADGKEWRPAEVDVSIRRGWFYHENEEPKSLAELVDIYYNSVGKGCCLLLNIPPDRRGLIPEADAQRLHELRALLDATFQTDLARGKPAIASSQWSREHSATNLTDGNRLTYWAAAKGDSQAQVTLDLEEPTTFNRLRIREQIALGQRIARFAVDAKEDGAWRELAAATTIGPQRILRLPDTTASNVRVRIIDTQATPTLLSLELYRAVSEKESLGE